jgi:hypothetical protein
LEGCIDLFTTFNNGSKFAASENGTTTFPVTKFLNLTNPTNQVNSIEYSISQDKMFILHQSNADNGLLELLTVDVDSGQTHFVGDVKFQSTGARARRIGQGLAIKKDVDQAYTWRNDTLFRMDLASGNITRQGISNPPRIDVLDLAYDNRLGRVYSLKQTLSAGERTKIHIWNPVTVNMLVNIAISDLPAGVTISGIAASPDNGEFRSIPLWGFISVYIPYLNQFLSVHFVILAL